MISSICQPPGWLLYSSLYDEQGFGRQPANLCPIVLIIPSYACRCRCCAGNLPRLSPIALITPSSACRSRCCAGNPPRFDLLRLVYPMQHHHFFTALLYIRFIHTRLRLHSLARVDYRRHLLPHYSYPCSAASQLSRISVPWPRTELTVICPPMASTNPLEIAMPRPDPLVVEAVSPPR